MATDPGYTVTIVTLNANTGAYKTLLGSRLARAIEIIEDGSANSGTGQGLQYMLPDPASPSGVQNWLGPFVIEPQTEPIVLGDKYAILGPYGAPISNGPGVELGVGVTAATPFIQIRSATTSTTTIRTTEFS
jgi:hypothetical protein